MTRSDAQVWARLEQVMDPELPVVSVVDLGIVREVEVDPARTRVHVTITPTYSGCPALEPMRREIAQALAEDFERVDISTSLAPAWTSDWITARGRERLAQAGIAPPAPTAGTARSFSGTRLAVLEQPAAVTCPACGSANTEVVAEFGATACKRLHRCLQCREPFEGIKTL